MSRYGLPYHGSKSTIAEVLLKQIPTAEHLYDLFGGGGAISHCAILMNKWNIVHYNEIKKPIVEFLQNAINGEYNYNKFKPDWISKEEFFKRKDTDAYVGLCWSFGNANKYYMFGKHIEAYKRSMHQAVVFGEFDDLAKEVLQRDSWDTTNIKERRLFLSHKIEHYKKTNSLPDCLIPFLKSFLQLKYLEHLERLQRLEHLERIASFNSSLSITSVDYREVEILPNSIIYCDIPYENTEKYGEFDRQSFLDWAANYPHPVYISEYNIFDDRFEQVFEIQKRTLMRGGQSYDKVVKRTEKLYWNKK